MIRRNTAGQVLYLPQLKLSADGTPVTAAATLTVAKDGTEAVAAGSLVHSANGVWKYTPTQAETDAAIVALILTATAADSIVLNLVTTGADTSATAFGANTTAPANSTIASIYSVVQLTDADVTTIKADVTTLLSRITSTVFSGITSLADWLRRLARKDAGTAGMIAAEAEIDTGGTSTFTGTTDSLEAIRDRGDAAWLTGESAGTGARTVTITVNDGAAALQNARVRLTEGVNTYVTPTNVSGVATFNVDDATYTVSITKSGYTYAGTTLLVNGDEAATYSMTEVVVTPPSNPSLSAIEVLCLGADDTAESGIDVDFRIVTIPSGDQNKAYSGAKKTVTSDGDGIARIEVAQGSTYEYKRGTAQIWSRVTVDADGVTNVTSFIGSP